MDFKSMLERSKARIAELAQAPAIMDVIHPEDDDDEAQNTTPEPPKAAGPVVLSSEQEDVIALVEAGHNVLVTGSAGTGKSTLLRALRERFKNRLPVTATTGIAAVNVEGVTLHSWAGLGLGELSAKAIARGIVSKQGKPYSNIASHDRLALDEVSMLSAELFTKIDHVFRYVRKNDKPFGGMQLILFGDFLQLPPVIKDQAEGCHGVFAFESKSWTEASIRVAILKKVFRQADAEFSQALNDIRIGNYTPLVSRLLLSRYRQQDPNPEIEPVVVHTHNVDVETFNEGRLNRLDGDAIEYYAADTGRESAAKLLEKNCLAPTLLRLKVGAQVMLLFNMEPESGLANGSIGVITGFSSGPGLRRPIVKFANGATRELERESWQIKDDNKVVAERFQIPLRLAWSITVHKSQGMTLDKIKVFLAKCFADGQAYVAMSRARTLNGLFIESGTKACIRASEAAVAFYRTEAEKTAALASKAPVAK